MKSLLALVTLALATLMLEERARQVAGDAGQVYDDALLRATEAKETVGRQVKEQPLISLMIAGGLAYFLASIVPPRH